jgi:hypothetical protein
MAALDTRNVVIYSCWLLQATGVTFPQVTKFWQGEPYRCMGAGVRTKKVAFVGVKVSIPATTCHHHSTIYELATIEQC